MPVARHLPPVLQYLTLSVIGSPMFIVSYPELVLAQYKAGIVGASPALNARPAEVLNAWLTQMNEDLAAYRVAHPDAMVGPTTVNQIAHHPNARLEQDVATCVKHKMPIPITSLCAPVKEVLDATHSYGGIALHDVVNLHHAEKALEAGVDGLILVAAGAGGHAGTLSSSALVDEVRRIFDGPIALSGIIATGDITLAAQATGADFAYVGTRFAANQEAHAAESYKQAILHATASDIVYTNLFTGAYGNYIRESIELAGLDPVALPETNRSKMSFGDGSSRARVWEDIWGVGQGVGQVAGLSPVAGIMARMKVEYDAVKLRPALHLRL